MSEQFPIVEISTQPIELCKLLKIANMVSGGGEAKIVISEGYVLLNGDVEFQKRKKIYDQDIIEFNGELIKVSYISLENKSKKTTSDRTADINKTKKTTELQQPEIKLTKELNSKRKPISF